MPLFDFRCRKCGATFEALVRKSEPTCKECGAADLERLVSLPALKSETTRALAMRAARKRDKTQATDRVEAQRYYEAHHDD